MTPSHPTPGTPSTVSEIQRLTDVVARLRAPGGCSWDRQQTIESLRPYVLEETYEVLEAIDQQDHQALCEELGDYLFEAAFVAQIEAEAGHFTLADAARCAADKLIRRHPHVFASSEGQPELDPAAVRTQWEEIKAQERRAAAKPTTLLSGLPGSLPALVRAHRLSGRAASVGFDWTHASDIVAKIQEGVDEVRAVVGDTTLDRARLEEEMGDLLFAMANLARKLGIEPESALRKANAKFTERFTAMERRVAASGRALSALSLEDMEAEWTLVKQGEVAGGA